MFKQGRFAWISEVYCFSAEIDEATALKPPLSCRRDKIFYWRYLYWMKPKP
ncbi:MAG: hypothetical protein MK236_03420 [Pedosphaera sp.]|nr:hypothetical protein [Pedosphaera sp.]